MKGCNPSKSGYPQHKVPTAGQRPSLSGPRSKSRGCSRGNVPYNLSNSKSKARTSNLGRCEEQSKPPNEEPKSPSIARRHSYQEPHSPPISGRHSVPATARSLGNSPESLLSKSVTPESKPSPLARGHSVSGPPQSVQTSTSIQSLNSSFCRYKSPRDPRSPSKDVTYDGPIMQMFKEQLDPDYLQTRFGYLSACYSLPHSRQRPIRHSVRHQALVGSPVIAREANHGDSQGRHGMPTKKIQYQPAAKDNSPLKGGNAITDSTSTVSTTEGSICGA